MCVCVCALEMKERFIIHYISFFFLKITSRQTLTEYSFFLPLLKSIVVLLRLIQPINGQLPREIVWDS